jgi:dienelactone hydrolase
MASHRLLALAALAFLAACGAPAAAPAPTPTPAPTPDALTLGDLGQGFDPVAGAFRTAAGALVVVTQQGWVVDTADGTVRMLVPGAGGYDVGPASGVREPVAGRVTVDDAGLTWTPTGRATLRATRLPLVRRAVAVPSAGVRLAGTLTLPAGGGRHAGIVLVHQGGPQVRAELDLWARFYAGLGYAVLSYDKRGEGESGGQYPGDASTAAVIDVLAADVRAAVAVLAAQPEADPARIGLVGHSQGGWVAPAAARGAPVAFLVLTSGAAVDGATEEAFSALSGNGATDPGLSAAAVAARLAGVHGGYDPGPALRALTVPTLWVYGGRDLAEPAALAAANVRRLARGAQVVMLRSGDHFLYDTPHGTFDEEPAATRYDPGLFPALTTWLAATPH